MSKEVTQIPNALKTVDNFINATGLQDVKASFNSKTGTASITGKKDGFQYCTTISKEDNGTIFQQSKFDLNFGKDALVSQIKELRKQNYKQQQIADMLGISQSLVSKYSRASDK